MSTYWNKRHEQWLNNQARMDTSTTKKLEKEYVRTANELEKEIASYFQRYGQDNVIEFRTMMQGLDKKDRDMLFKDMDAFAEKHPEYAHLMPVRESVYKLNRLQGLHYSTQMKLLELGAIEQKELEKHLEKTYGKRYEQVMKELGLGNQFLAIDRQLMQNTIYAKWINNENFSQRIWKNKDKLLNHLTTKYRDGLARGDNYAQLTKNIMERFNVGLNDAKRLVWTEASFVYNQSHTHAYKDVGVEEYELTAIMDSRTSRICRAMDGKRFRFAEMEVGVNFPPFHAYCRTTFIGVLDGFLESGKTIEDNIPEISSELISEDVINRRQEEEAITNEIIELQQSLKNSNDKAERRRLLNELEERYENDEISTSEYNRELNRIKDMFKNKTNNRTIREQIGKLSNELELLKEKNSYANAEHIKQVLGKYRSMGVSDIEVAEHLSSTRSIAGKAIMQAYDHLPTDWVRRSVEHGNLKVKTVKRGYYSHGMSEIAISKGQGNRTSFRTAIHELGHRQEHINPAILEAEKVFYEKRTQGDKLQRLRDVSRNKGYGADEFTRVDDFIEPYMGKDYGGRAYELLTMGMDTLYTDPIELSKDPEMFDWVVKMILTK